MNFILINYRYLLVVCSLDCGPHGVCAEGVCRCDDGWTGARCDQRPCDSRCHDHGQCKNGTCVCTQGWNGRHCTLRKLWTNEGQSCIMVLVIFLGQKNQLIYLGRQRLDIHIYIFHVSMFNLSLFTYQLFILNHCE